MNQETQSDTTQEKKSTLLSIQSILLSDKTLGLFGALPLFFSWLPLVTWRYPHDSLRDVGLYSAINTIGFFLCLVLGVLFYPIPEIGGYVSNGFHILGIASYLVVSIFLVYLVASEKKIVIPVLSGLKSRLDGFLRLDSEDPSTNPVIAPREQAGTDSEVIRND